jgi:hypothetical protein
MEQNGGSRQVRSRKNTHFLSFWVGAAMYCVRWKCYEWNIVSVLQNEINALSLGGRPRNFNHTNISIPGCDIWRAFM